MADRTRIIFDLSLPFGGTYHKGIDLSQVARTPLFICQLTSYPYGYFNQQTHLKTKHPTDNPIHTNLVTMERLASFPSEILIPIISELSDEEIIHLPLSVLEKGLTNSSAKARYPTINVTLDRSGLGRLYQISSKPLIASSIRQMIIQTDRIITPTPSEWQDYIRLCHYRSYKSRPITLFPNAFSDVHAAVGVMNPRNCKVCRSTSFAAQLDALRDAARSEREMEDSALDYSILAYALRRMHRLESVYVESGFNAEEVRCARVSDGISGWPPQWRRNSRVFQYGYAWRQYWDLMLDLKRTEVSLLKAMLVTGKKLSRDCTERFLRRPCEWQGKEVYWMHVENEFEYEKEGLKRLEKNEEGKERTTRHAYWVWERFLQSTGLLVGAKPV